MTQGVKGAQGGTLQQDAKTRRGPKGTRGAKGGQGASGAQGQQETQGTQGTEGTQGTQETQGTQGPKAQRGTGTGGPKGPPKAQGAQKPKGPRGNGGPGLQASAGGPKSPRGQGGPGGQKGPQGPKGLRGQGNQGNPREPREPRSLGLISDMRCLKVFPGALVVSRRLAVAIGAHPGFCRILAPSLLDPTSMSEGKKKGSKRPSADAQRAWAGEVDEMLHGPNEDGVSLLGRAGAAEATTQAPPRKKLRKVYKLSKCPVCQHSVEACAAWVAESKSRVGKRILEGPGCLRCADLYEDGNFKYMKTRKLDTFEMFCDACEKDQSFRESCQVAQRVKDKTSKRSYENEECTLVTLEGWRAEDSYVGVTSKNFQTKYGCSITAAGYKTHDLQNTLGATYKGMLQTESDEPNTKYVKYTDTVVARKIFKMPMSACVREGQGQDVFTHSVGQQAIKGMWQKLRCCSVTDRDVKQKIAKRGADKKETASGPGTPAPGEEDDDDNEEEEESDEEEEEEEVEADDAVVEEEAKGAVAAAQASVHGQRSYTTPTKGERSDRGEGSGGPLSDAASLATSLRKRRSSVALGTPSPSGKGESAMPVFDSMAFLMAKIGCGGSACDSEADAASLASAQDEFKKKSEWNKKKSVQQHIRDISHTGILGGAKVKVAMRFARIALGDIDPAVDVAGHSLLSIHLRVADECYTLVEADWHAIELDALSLLVTPVVVAKVDMPTSMKMRLLVKHAVARCKSAGLMTEASLKKFATMMTPWVKDGQMAEFDAHSPRLAAVEGNPKEKAAIFANIFVDRLLCVFIKGGKSDAETLVRVAGFLESEYADFGAIDDAYLEVLSVLLSVCRASLTLLEPTRVDGFEEAMALYNAVTDKSDATLLKKIAVVMWNTPHYRQLLTDFNNKRLFTQQCMPKVTACLATLDGASAGDAVPTFAELSAAVELYATIASNARQGLGEKLMDVLLPRLNDAKKAFSDDLSNTQEDQKGELKSALTLFRLVAKTLPSSACNVAKELSAATTLMATLELDAQARGITDKYNEITKQWLDEASAEDLGVFIGMATGIDQSSFPKKDMNDVVEALLGAVRNDTLGNDKGRACVDVCVEISGMSCCCLSDGHKGAIEVLAAGKNLESRVNAWKALGTTLDERLKADRNNQALLTAMVALKALEEKHQAMAPTIDCFPSIALGKSKAEEAINGATGHILEEAKAMLQASLGSMRVAMGEVIGAEKNWKDQLQANPTWSSLMKVARTSLLELSPEEGSVSALLANLTRADKEYRKLNETFDASYSKQLSDSAKEAMECATLGVWEAKFLLGVEALGKDVIKLQKLSHALQAEPMGTRPPPYP